MTYVKEWGKYIDFPAEIRITGYLVILFALGLVFMICTHVALRNKYKEIQKMQIDIKTTQNEK